MIDYDVIGDCHIGFKAYDSNKRTEECLWVFEEALKLCTSNLIIIPGDLLDDTIIPNWVEKRLMAIFHSYTDKEFIILAGNHDSTKTYNSVTALDVFAELPNIKVLGEFKTHSLETFLLAIPHMKSQKEFKNAIMAVNSKYDVCILHAMYGSKLDLGPNDLNIDEEMATHLMKFCKKIYIGHQHNPVIINDQVVLTGAIMEFTFGELGPKYLFHSDGTMSQIPQPRSLARIDVVWQGVNDILDKLYNLDTNTIYKLVVTGLPPSEYSNCMSVIEGVVTGFAGDFIYELIKAGHEDIEIGTIDSSFDLAEEFKLFCEANNYSYAELEGDLSDAISALASEEEDLTI